MKKILSIALIAIIASAMVFAGGSSESAADDGTSPIKIGAMYALS